MRDRSLLIAAGEAATVGFDLPNGRFAVLLPAVLDGNRLAFEVRDASGTGWLPLSRTAQQGKCAPVGIDYANESPPRAVVLGVDDFEAIRSIDGEVRLTLDTAAAEDRTIVVRSF